MPEKLNTIKFIEKSQSIFGKVLDYSKTQYINSRTSVCMICPVHGKFHQKPSIHFSSKHPCPKCSKNIPTITTLINRFRDIHSNKYEYFIKEYINDKQLINIKCEKHGMFSQKVREHLDGSGCARCANNLVKTNEEFVIRAKNNHGDRYSYTLSRYVNNYTPVIIICRKHGQFKQTPVNHYKYGCLKCSGKFLKENFIKEATAAHNGRYDYSLVDYQGMFQKIKIICSDHGVFLQTPSNHLHHQKGCGKCSFRMSKAETLWLDNLGVPERQKYINIDNKKFFVDGFNPITNTVYEFNGDYWHGNPKIYNQDSKSYFGIKFGDLYNRTKKKEEALKQAGFNVISIWESDFENNKT